MTDSEKLHAAFIDGFMACVGQTFKDRGDAAEAALRACYKLRSRPLMYACFAERDVGAAIIWSRRLRYAWLIEKPGSPPIWFAGGDGQSGAWTTDANNAIWFSRKSDGEWAIKALQIDYLGYIVTEHGFEDAALAASSVGETVATPNTITVQTMEDVEAGRNVTEAGTLENMFKELDAPPPAPGTIQTNADAYMPGASPQIVVTPPAPADDFCPHCGGFHALRDECKPAPAEKRWKVVCKTCGATEEGSDGEIPLRLHGRMEGGQWQHYVANAFTAHEWCGPVVEASKGGGT